MTDRGLRARIALARASGRVSRMLGRGGTSLPGKVLLRLAPDVITTLGKRLEHGNVVISATNGKTTTAAMAAAILQDHGSDIVYNRAGANMAGGIAATLMEAARPREAMGGDTGLFEVDEFWLDEVVPRLAPRALLLANLFRDQLDRYGELETIADRWAALVPRVPQTQLVLNADDPLVADLGRARADGPAGMAPTTYFGVEDAGAAREGLQHASDSTHCRRCGAPYVYDLVFLGHLGHYGCEACGSRRPVPGVQAHDVRLDGVRGARFRLVTPDGEAEVALPLPGLYNVYNALAAAALTGAVGVPLATVVSGLQRVGAAFGRAETVSIEGRETTLMLVKNPAGANEVLHTLALEDGEHDLFAILNDNIADGRDISWVWDADFEVLAPHIRRATCSGTRAAEMALRLKYAGVPLDRIVVVPGLAAGLDAALEAGDGRLFALPTYTAMLALREELVARGVAGSSFG